MNKSNLLMILLCSVFITNVHAGLQISKKHVSNGIAALAFVLGKLQDRSAIESLKLEEGNSDSDMYDKGANAFICIIGGGAAMANNFLTSNNNSSNQKLILNLAALAAVANGLRLEKSYSPKWAPEKRAALEGKVTGTLFGITAGILISNLTDYLTTIKFK